MSKKVILNQNEVDALVTYLVPTDYYTLNDMLYDLRQADIHSARTLVSALKKLGVNCKPIES